MRIAQVIQSVDAQQGGTSAAFVEVLEALRTQRERLNVTAFAPSPPEDDPVRDRIEDSRSVNWCLTGPAGGFRAGALAKVVEEAISDRAIELVQIHGVWSSDLVSIAKSCVARGVPYLWTPHGMLMDYAYSHKRLKKALFMRLGLANALRNAAGLVFACSGEREISVLPRGVDRARGVVVGLPVDLSRATGDLGALRDAGRTRFGVNDDERCIVFIGRLHPVKRLELTIEALRLACNEIPTIRLILLGDGDSEYVEGLRVCARRAGVEDRVVFAGWVSGDEKWEGLAAGDALVINSKHENFGYAIIEALGVGTPVLMTEHLSMAPDVRQEDAGAIVANNAKSLGEGMIRILSSNESLQMAERGRTWVVSSFSREAVGKQLASVYETTVRGDSGGA